MSQTPREAGPNMEVVEDKSFRDETVSLDGKLFVRCNFESCTLVFAGGHCEWEASNFSHCRVTLEGAASNTLQVLRALGIPISADGN